jgi:hypothetical protein
MQDAVRKLVTAALGDPVPTIAMEFDPEDPGVVAAWPGLLDTCEANGTPIFALSPVPGG